MNLDHQVSVCCGAGPVDEIDHNSFGHCEMCKEPTVFEPIVEEL